MDRLAGRHGATPTGARPGLLTDGLSVYTFGGVGLPNMNMITSGAGSQPMAFNIQNYQTGPWRALSLPNGTTMSLPTLKFQKNPGLNGISRF